jgi:hypothetical protein
MKIWTYKSTRNAKEVGVVVQLNRVYYKIPSEYLFCNINGRSNRKRRKLKISWVSTFSFFTCFPSYLCKPRHYLEADKIYIHEIFRLLKKLR